MSYYILPTFSSTIDVDNIAILLGNSDEIISKSLFNYLNSMKQQIDLYENSWDIYKKFTNPYEYIHSIIPNLKNSISKLKPISRSFYKLIEINSMLHICDDFKENIKSFHLAEGPGGFIEAMTYIRASFKNDLYYGMTLINNNCSIIPGWKKSENFLNKYSNIKLEYGHDKTGDLFNIENLWYCYNKYKGSIDLITGDGGFDFSIDFNKQEINANKLIFCQVCFAIAMQKKNGCFILKVFDIFTNATIDILYLLSQLYKKLYIVKPNTSRYANSERYIICKYFKNDDIFDILTKLSNIYPFLNANISIKRYLKIDIPYIFINKIEDINAIIGQQQLENILSTFYLIENGKDEKIEIIKKNNIQKCIQWCIKNKIPYNKNSHLINVFYANNNI